MNKKIKNVTIYDVAREAGVSTSTVSRTLRDEGYPVSSKTREKVYEAVKKLNYDIEIYEKKQEDRSEKRIAVVVPNIINPYYSTLITGVEYNLHVSGMEMVLYSTGGSKDKEVSVVEDIVESKPLGVIIISICENHDHIQKLIDANISVVACEQSIDLDCNSVTFNFFEGGLMATEYLISKGKKKIAFISSPLDRYSRISLFNGYKKALKRNSIELDKKLIKISKTEKPSGVEMFEFKNGKDQIDALIREKNIPDAIFCINDITAIGVIQRLKECGYDIPGDISVIGFDNIYISSMIYPSLTTIDQSTYELGTMATEILLGSINDSARGNVSTVLEPKLIIRDSV
jgi:LacI family transcriptional regulator